MGQELLESFTFDDVSLLPQYSEVLPAQVDLSVSLTASLRLKIPLCSSAMDTVTEQETAMAMAQLGGLGVIHRNLPPQKQAEQVAFVKSKKGDPHAAVDANGHLLCGAAVGPGIDFEERVLALLSANVDLIVIDTAHGHSKGVLDAVRTIRARHAQLALAAGNVVTPEGVTALAEAGADIIKVGVGPGSICTTRVVAGVGVPQLSAILWCARAAKEHGVKIIADGGVKYSGDIVKALTAGAHAVMIGSLLAGTQEAPGEDFLYNGRAFKAYRGMGSLGAMSQGSKDRYGQAHTDNDKLVPEGIEGRIPFKGPLSGVVHQLMGGLRSGMGYLGAPQLEALHRIRSPFVRISSSGLRESHVHDVTITKEAPNYHFMT